MKRTIKAPTGTELQAKSWLTEAPLRMLMNNLDPEVAERPQDLVVYGGIGKAARNWDCFDAIVGALKQLDDDETLLVQSGKPVGVFRTHADAPRVMLRGGLNRRGNIMIEVVDHGPGIPEGIARKIFVPFFTTKEKGSGVGLALARQVMTAHGGFIRVANNADGGATFTLTF